MVLVSPVSTSMWASKFSSSSVFTLSFESFCGYLEIGRTKQFHDFRTDSPVIYDLIINCINYMLYFYLLYSSWFAYEMRKRDKAGPNQPLKVSANTSKYNPYRISPYTLSDDSSLVLGVRRIVGTWCKCSSSASLQSMQLSDPLKSLNLWKSCQIGTEIL